MGLFGKSYVWFFAAAVIVIVQQYRIENLQKENALLEISVAELENSNIGKTAHNTEVLAYQQQLEKELFNAQQRISTLLSEHKKFQANTLPPPKKEGAKAPFSENRNTTAKSEPKELYELYELYNKPL